MVQAAKVSEKGSGGLEEVTRGASVRKREAGVVLWASIVSPYGHNFRDSSKVVRSYEPICNWQARVASSGLWQINS